MNPPEQNIIVKVGDLFVDSFSLSEYGNTITLTSFLLSAEQFDTPDEARDVASLVNGELKTLLTAVQDYHG